MKKPVEPRIMYRVAELPPPPTVRVWLFWAGWLGEGGRGFVKGRERWVAWVDGRPEELPPAGARDRKGRVLEGQERPELWAPLYPESWALPLPEPVPVVEPRMWSSRQSFNATEAAAEMEADREAARTNAGEDARGRRRTQWWRDATLIRYSPPGSISKREAEGRVMRALAGDTGERFSDGAGLHRPRGMSDDDLREMAEREAALVRGYIVHFEPLPMDRSDEEIALGWYSAAPDMVLRYAADDRCLSWSEIGAALGRLTRQAAEQRYAAAIEAIWTIANGFHNPRAEARAARHEALVAANRAFKRQEREGDLL